MSEVPVPSPSIRAAWSARALRALEDRDAEAHTRVLARLGNALEPLQRGSSLAWIPMELHVSLLRAIVEEFGSAEARAMLRESARANFSGSLLKGAVLGTLRVFGVGPLAIARMFPRGFRMVTRACGSVSTRTSREDGTFIDFEQLPEVIRDPAWVVSVSAMFDAVLDIAKLSGTVEADASALADGRLSIHMRADDRELLVYDPDDSP
jgi:hypothetical protein